MDFFENVGYIFFGALLGALLPWLLKFIESKIQRKSYNNKLVTELKNTLSGVIKYHAIIGTRIGENEKEEIKWEQELIKELEIPMDFSTSHDLKEMTKGDSDNVNDIGAMKGILDGLVCERGYIGIKKFDLSFLKEINANFDLVNKTDIILSIRDKLNSINEIIDNYNKLYESINNKVANHQNYGSRTIDKMKEIEYELSNECFDCVMKIVCDLLKNPLCS